MTGYIGRSIPSEISDLIISMLNLDEAHGYGSAIVGDMTCGSGDLIDKVHSSHLRVGIDNGAPDPWLDDSFFNHRGTSFDILICHPNGRTISEPMIDLDCAKFGPHGPSSVVDSNLGCLEYGLKSKTFFCGIFPYEFVVSDEAIQCVTDQKNIWLHECARFFIDSSFFGENTGSIYVLLIWCNRMTTRADRPVVSRIHDSSDIDKAFKSWMDSPWWTVIQKFWVQIAERGPLSHPPLFKKTLKLPIERFDLHAEPLQVKICVDGHGECLRVVACNERSLARLNAFSDKFGWLCHQAKFNKKYPLLWFRLRARHLARNPSDVWIIKDLLSSFGFNVVVHEDVAGWLAGIQRKLEVDSFTFEQNVYSESDNKWEIVNSESGVRTLGAQNYNYWKEHLKTNIKWPLFSFQRDDIARMLTKGSALYASFMGSGKTRAILTYIRARGGKRNLIVLESKLIDELMHEASVIGENLEDFHVVDSAESADPSKLKRVNILSYSQVWRPAPGPSGDVKYREKFIDKTRYKVQKGGKVFEEFANGHVDPLDVIPSGFELIEYEHTKVLDGENFEACKTIAHVLRKTRFNTIVFDEAHRLMGGVSTKQSKYSKLLKAKHVIGATGTVINNYPRNVYGLLVQAFGEQTVGNMWSYHLPTEDPDDLNCTTGTRIFKKKFVQIGYTSSQFDETLEEGWKGREIPLVPEESLDEWWDMISTKILRRSRYEPIVMNEIPMPDADYEEVYFKLDPEHARFYKWWLDEFYDWLMEQIANEKTGEGRFDNAGLLSLLGKLQFAATVPQADNVIKEGIIEWHGGLTSKQSGVVDCIVDEMKIGHKVILFSERPDALNLLHDHFGELGHHSVLFHGGIPMAKRLKSLKDFKKHAGPSVLLMSRTCGNTGYNISEADTVWQLDWSWTPSAMLQSEGRMLRPNWPNLPGREGRKPRVRRAIQTGTIDEYMKQLIDLKSDGISQAIDRQDAEWNPEAWMSYRDFSIKMFRELGFDI